MISQTIYENLSQYLKVDTEQLLQDFVTFINGADKRAIESFYKGKTTQRNYSAFENRDELFKKLHNAVELAKDFKTTNAEYWELLELLEEAHSTMYSYMSIEKWLRSSISANQASAYSKQEYITRGFDTLEGISDQYAIQSTQNESWYNLALSNDLREEDYDSSGGEKLSLSYRLVNSIEIRSVVAVLNNLAIYGLDLDAHLQFTEDGSLKTLSYQDTIKQAVAILTKITKGSVPELPTIGISQNIVAGSNINSVAIPVVIRQLIQLFKLDDTLKSFAIQNIGRQDDAMYIEFSVETRIGEFIDQKIVYE